MLRRWALLAALLLFAVPAFAADVYIRDGASGAGTTWADACDDFSGSCSTLVRGNTYYIAGGNYAGRTFNTATSGTTLITIKAATIAAHGTDTGWMDSYSVENGPAYFANSGASNLNFRTSYWVFDGVIGDRSATKTDYGFVLDGPGTCSAAHFLIMMGNSAVGLNLTDFAFSHVAFASNCTDAVTVVSVKNHSQVDDVDNLSCYYCYHIDVTGAFECNGDGGTGCDDWDIRYNYMAELSDVPGLHYEWVNANGMEFHNLTFAFNIVARTQRGTGGIVANNKEIIGCEIYSNLFLNYTSNSNGMIGAGTSHWFEDCTIVNNTFANMTSGPTIKLCVGANCTNATGNVVENNICFNCTNPIVISCGTGCTQDYNAFFQVSFPPIEINGQISVSDPFVDSAGGDYELAANTDAGVTLMSPYTTDIDGVTFASGGEDWSRGAYQFVNPDPDPPTPGAGITFGAVTSTTTIINWDKGTDAVTPQASLQYQVCRSSSNNIGSNCTAGTIIQPYVVSVTLCSASCTFTATGLSPSTTYWYNVTIKDEAGNEAAYVTDDQATSAAPVSSNSPGIRVRINVR